FELSEVALVPRLLQLAEVVLRVIQECLGLESSRDAPRLLGSGVRTARELIHCRARAHPASRIETRTLRGCRQRRRLSIGWRVHAASHASTPTAVGRLGASAPHPAAHE